MTIRTAAEIAHLTFKESMKGEHSIQSMMIAAIEADRAQRPAPGAEDTGGRRCTCPDPATACLAAHKPTCPLAPEPDPAEDATRALAAAAAALVIQRSGEVFEDLGSDITNLAWGLGVSIHREVGLIELVRAAVDLDRAKRPDDQPVRIAYDAWSEAAEGGSADQEHAAGLALGDEILAYFHQAHPESW